MSNSLKNSALEYAARGWSVIPLRFTGDTSERKRPLLDSWDEYQKTPATIEQVELWWTGWPQANIGIVTGEVSGLVVIDLDGPHAKQLLADAKVFFPSTAAVQTGGGFHAYYLHPGVPVANKARLLSDGGKSGVDVRGDGGYVVAPPSVHGSGRVYQWVVDQNALAPLSAGLLDLIQRKGQTGPIEHADASWVDEAMRGVPEGQRDETCAKLAGYWLRLVDPEDCLRILRPFAEGCTPPFAERDVRKTIQSVHRLEATRQAAELEQRHALPGIVEPAAWLEEIESAAEDVGRHIAVPGMSLIGGLVPGRLITLAGRTRMGKSTFACQVSVEAGIRAKIPTLILSTEMSRKEWGTWMAAYLSGTTVEQLPKPLRDKARQQWLESPIAIADPGTVNIKNIRELAESRVGLKLLIVDHVGRIVGGRRDSRVLEVGDVMRGLKSLAKDLDCTVLSLCQLNRRVEGAEDKEPRLDDLRESGEVEQESDAVFFLWTDSRDKYAENLPMTLSLEKNRHGPTGKVGLTFDKGHRCFRESDTVPF
jgi:hypothetical protein